MDGWMPFKHLNSQIVFTAGKPTVEVGVEEKAYDFAHRLAKGPVVGARVVVDEEGQREDVQRVAHRQVEHVDGGRRPALGAERDDKQGHGVEREAEQEDQRVADGQQQVLEVLLEAAEVEVRLMRRVGEIHPG